MNSSPEIEAIVEEAAKIAHTKRHEYVLTEHLLLALIRHQPFRKTLEKFGTEIALLDLEIEAYVDSLVGLIKDIEDLQPKKTQTLERIFNRANVQAMFTGRRNLTTADLYLSIMSENNSHAHHFLLKYGVKKSEFVEFWNRTPLS